MTNLLMLFTKCHDNKFVLKQLKEKMKKKIYNVSQISTKSRNLIMYSIEFRWKMISLDSCTHSHL